MNSNYFHMPYVYPYVTNPYQAPYVRYPYSHYYGSYQSYQDVRQPVRGQATWTEGGAVTQCGIPWSANLYMTVAVGQNTPYKCGDTLKIKNLANGREVLVTVVDQVAGYGANKVNLHKRAFEALGANVDLGVINVEITTGIELEEEKWGKYLLEIVQSAYSNYNVTDYNRISKTQQNANQMTETYKYVLRSPQETINIEGTVAYNPNTDRIISIDLKEV
ncbi:RlpA-like double-psi beta-barrel domain-containing protein [Thalassobacillus devorans]|uniref:RlpA-like double-psi beta-barrel domain-containing protein n=1 Tax=Thalassobacillus devorans TaxID=279813 RepID=UPI00048AD6CF|nr:RlpA-like double-psi beta-barrel domain-containing protein [Thalassobacillus devorans]